MNKMLTNRSDDNSYIDCVSKRTPFIVDVHWLLTLVLPSPMSCQQNDGDRTTTTTKNNKMQQEQMQQ